MQTLKTLETLKTLIPVMALAGFVGVSAGAQRPAPPPSPATPQSSPAQPQNGPEPPAPPAPPAPLAQPQSNANSPAVPVPSTANVPEVANPQLRPVTGELEKKLDSKNAKPGDPVVVKTTEKAAIANGIVIPKGSLIVGHVTDVQPHSKTNENARLTIKFDQAQLKGGETLPIATLLENVAPAEVTVHPTDTLNAQPAPMAAPGATAGSPGRMTAGSPTGAPQSGSAASAPSSVTGVPTTSAGSENQAASAAPKTGAVVARQGNVAIKTTALPGVLLATNADGKPFSNASGALLGAKQNVHLDGGTEFVIAVVDKGPKP